MKLQRYNGNFARCLSQANEAIREGKITRLATARDGMLDRIAQGVNSDACRNGFWFPENYNSVQGEILLALKDYNPIIPYAPQAVEAHRNNQEFYLTEDILLKGKSATQVLRAIAEEDAIKPAHQRRVLLCKNKVPETKVTTSKLGEEEEVVFLARGENLAREYGEFLDEKADIKQTSIYRPPIILGKDLARGFWLHGLGGGSRSDFSGGDRGLYDGDGSLFGVRGRRGREIGVADSQKILPYTQRDVKTAERELNKLSKVLQPNQLEKLLILIQKLKQ